MRGSNALARIAVLAAVLALAAGACKKADPSSRPSRPAGGGSVPSSAPSQPVSSPTSGEGGGGETQVGDDDLKVFGFATTDTAVLAGEMADVASTIAKLEEDTATRDVNAAEADAKTLLNQADALGADTSGAESRQRPLEPADQTLVKARADAIDAFGLTADYANMVADLADAALSLSLTELVDVAEQAMSLAGTSDDLTNAYSELMNELVTWAEANPTAAAAALAKYS